MENGMGLSVSDVALLNRDSGLGWGASPTNIQIISDTAVTLSNVNLVVTKVC